MSVKRLYLLVLLAFITNIAYSSLYIRTSVFKNGVWYPWEMSSGVEMSGTYDRFSVHHFTNDPSAFYFRVTIDNFSIPDKKVLKSHIKNDEWYEYTGYIEYWIDDDHMDFLSCLSGWALPINAVPWNRYDGRPSIIKKSRARIRIAPYEKTPRLYTIWFEEIGYSFYFFDIW